MSLHFESAPPHIWYLMQTFSPKIDPLSICSLTVLKTPRTLPLCHMCVIELVDGPSGVNEEAIIAPCVTVSQCHSDSVTVSL